MADWKRRLNADPTGWLLETQDPPIRYWTLTDILGRPPDDPEVQAVQGLISTYPPIADLLASQESDGHWGKQDFYLPRASHGTFWVLSLLGDLGLTAEEEHIHRACEFMFAHQRLNGAFCRRRRISGQGLVWQEQGEPCTQARIGRFLIQFGWADDPRLRQAIDWLLPLQRDDGMWFCRPDGARGCLRATQDVLRLAALDPQTAAQPGIAKAAQVVCELLMVPRMYRYHVGEAWGTWECLKYPYFGFSVISVLDALARLGYTLLEPGIAAAVEYLLGRQLADGSWPMDAAWPESAINFGQPGQPNKWLTLDALRVIRLLYG